uniref:RNA-directed RNA polymerase L n=1 Tax=Soybean thrips-associated tospovirus 1 TaxID=2797875 RepID=A0A7T7WM18_9VIRU|nr:RNA-dependent RNA polymerase [Soybean thrips-associated tospovirus 1]
MPSQASMLEFLASLESISVAIELYKAEIQKLQDAFLDHSKQTKEWMKSTKVRDYLVDLQMSLSNMNNRIAELIEVRREHSLLESKAIFGVLDLEEQIVNIMTQYKHTELLRHDLFGSIIAYFLGDRPKMKQAEYSLTHICDEFIEAVRAIDDTLGEQKLESTNSFTPDSYTISGLWQEGEDGVRFKKPHLIIYDWKVNRTAEQEEKTFHKYYNAVKSIFSSINCGSTPFLEKYHVYISIILLNPDHGKVESTIYRVNPKTMIAMPKRFERIKRAKEMKICKVHNIKEVDREEYVFNIFTKSGNLMNQMLNHPELIDQGDEQIFRPLLEDDQPDFIESPGFKTLKDIIMVSNPQVMSKFDVCMYIFGSPILDKKNTYDEVNKSRVELLKEVLEHFCGLKNFFKKSEKKKSRKIKNVEDVLCYFEKMQEKERKVYSEHIETIKARVAKDNKDSAKFEKLSINEAFNLNAVDYESKYPGCFQDNLAKTSKNFSVTWSPQTTRLKKEDEQNISNMIAMKFKEDMEKSAFSIWRPYGIEADEKRHKRFSDISLGLKTLFRDVVDTSNMPREEYEDVIDPETLKIVVTKKKVHKKFANISVKGANEFTYAGHSCGHFRKMIAHMKIEMSKEAKIEASKEKEEIMLKNKTMTEESGHYRFDQSIDSMFDDEELKKESEKFKFLHDKKLIRHDNSDADYYGNQMKEGLCNLLKADARESTKTKEVFDFYCSDPEKIVHNHQNLRPELERTKVVHDIASRMNLYSYGNDIYMLAQGLILAGLFNKSTDFKLITTSNNSMITVAFKGDNLNGDGVPFIQIHRVHEKDMQDFEQTHTREILGKSHGKKFSLYIMDPSRLNKTRLLNLFKSPSKIMLMFSTYMMQDNELINALKAIMDDSKKENFGNLKARLYNIVFSSIVFGTITKLGRMGLVDFFRYAGILPLSDYSNVLGYIVEKFDPDINNVLDWSILKRIKENLIQQMNINTSTHAVPLTIDSDDYVVGGLKDFKINCVITGNELKSIDDFYTNIFLAIYMMPKEMHNHTHNLISLINVPAEWELKFREKFGFGIDDIPTPKKEMFDDSGSFSMNLELFLISVRKYYHKFCTSIPALRTNILRSEKLLSPVYNIDTLGSDKKCNSYVEITLEEIETSILESLEIVTNGTRSSKQVNFSSKCFSITTGACIAHMKDTISFGIFKEPEQVNNAIMTLMMDSDYNRHVVGRANKIYTTTNMSEFMSFMKLSLDVYKPVKSKKVQEELFSSIAEQNGFYGRDLQTLYENRHNTTTFMKLLKRFVDEALISREKNMFLVTIFEKMQRTKVDREIYLMSFKVKCMLYYPEHIFKMIAQSDPSEAISISGDKKIHSFTEMVRDTYKIYTLAVKESKQYGTEMPDMTQMSSDQSKWSASDNSWKYLMLSMMCPVLTKEETQLMCNIFHMYITEKRASIPNDIMGKLLKSKEKFGGDANNPLYRATAGYTRNTFPICSNWLQGNLNYMSSVVHAVIMDCLKDILLMINKTIVLKWLVHSDDSVSSIVIGQGAKEFVGNFGCRNLSECYFKIVAAHVTSFTVKTNTKKSSTSKSVSEFISIRTTNGVIVPNKAKCIAGCTSASSHASYFEDVSSSFQAVCDALRNGITCDLIPFLYAATTHINLATYAAMPRESNCAMTIAKKIGYDGALPVVLGGWFKAPMEYLAVLGPSCNDQLIYAELVLELFGYKDLHECRADFFRDVKSTSRKLSLIAQARLQPEDKINQMKLRTFKKSKYSLLINLFAAYNKSNDVEQIETSVKFRSFTPQVLKLPKYTREGALNKFDSFQEFCERFPSLRKNKVLTEASMLDNIEVEVERDMDSLVSFLIDNPEIFLIAPMNDEHFFSHCVTRFISRTLRESLTTVDTDRLGIDRMLRARAENFFDSEANVKVTWEKRMTTIMSSFLTNQDVDLMAKATKAIVTLLVSDTNFLMCDAVLKSTQMTRTEREVSNNSKVFRTKKLPPFLGNSPGLSVIQAIYGQSYIDGLGMHKVDLTSGRMETFLNLYRSDTIDKLLRKWLQERYNQTLVPIIECSEQDLEEFERINILKKMILGLNYMTVMQNNLMRISNQNRKPFHIIITQRADNFTTCCAALWGSIYSAITRKLVIASAELIVDPETRLLITKEVDLDFENLLAVLTNIANDVTSIYPDATVSDLRQLLEDTYYNNRLLMDQINKYMEPAKSALNAPTSSRLQRMRQHTELYRAMIKHLPTLANLEFLNNQQLNIIRKFIHPYDVQVIKEESVDRMGNYIADAYKSTLTTMTNGGTIYLLESTMLKAKISVSSASPPYDDEDFLESYKSDLMRLARTWQTHMRKRMKGQFPREAKLIRGNIYALMSSKGAIYLKMHTENYMVEATNVIAEISVYFTQMPKELWDQDEADIKVLPYEPGLSIINFRYEIDSSDPDRKIINAQLASQASIKKVMDEMRELVKDEEGEENWMEFGNSLNFITQVEDILENIVVGNIDQVEDSLDIIENLKVLAPDASEKDKKVMEIIINKYESMGNMRKLLSLASSAANNVALFLNNRFAAVKPSTRKSPRYFSIEIKDKRTGAPIAWDGYQIQGMLRFLQLCQAAHSIQSIIPLDSMDSCLSKDISGPRLCLYSSRRSESQNVLILGELELKQKDIEILEAQGFIVDAGEVFDGTDDVYNLDDLKRKVTEENMTHAEMFYETMLMAKLIERKPAYLIDANVMILRSLMSYISTSLDFVEMGTPQMVLRLCQLDSSYENVSNLSIVVDMVKRLNIGQEIVSFGRPSGRDKRIDSIIKSLYFILEVMHFFVAEEYNIGHERLYKLGEITSRVRQGDNNMILTLKQLFKVEEIKFNKHVHLNEKPIEICSEFYKRVQDSLDHHLQPQSLSVISYKGSTRQSGGREWI